MPAAAFSPTDGRRAASSSRPRLRRPPEFARVLHEGRALSSRRMVVYVAAGQGPSRVGFVTGRKLGTAVARNRARRLLRESWRGLADRTREEYDIVLIARASLRGASLAEVAGELRGLLDKAGVLR